MPGFTALCSSLSSLNSRRKKERERERLRVVRRAVRFCAWGTNRTHAQLIDTYQCNGGGGCLALISHHLAWPPHLLATGHWQGPPPPGFHFGIITDCFSFFFFGPWKLVYVFVSDLFCSLRSKSWLAAQSTGFSSYRLTAVHAWLRPVAEQKKI